MGDALIKYACVNLWFHRGTHIATSINIFQDFLHAWSRVSVALALTLTSGVIFWHSHL